MKISGNYMVRCENYLNWTIGLLILETGNG